MLFNFRDNTLCIVFVLLASIMNEQGVNITAIQRMLGHTKITTTQHYITTNRGFIKEEMLKAMKGMSDMFEGEV